MRVRPEGLEQVFQRALYRVDWDPPLVLRVGRESAELAELYAHFSCSSAAFLTAANPGGVKKPDTFNRLVEQRLTNTLKALSLPLVPGIGLDADPTSDWPGERSLLAMGISRQCAIDVAHQFAQLVIVWCPPSRIPELLMLENETVGIPTPSKR